MTQNLVNTVTPLPGHRSGAIPTETILSSVQTDIRTALHRHAEGCAQERSVSRSFWQRIPPDTKCSEEGSKTVCFRISLQTDVLYWGKSWAARRFLEGCPQSMKKGEEGRMTSEVPEGNLEGKQGRAPDMQQVVFSACDSDPPGTQPSHLLVSD